MNVGRGASIITNEKTMIGFLIHPPPFISVFTFCSLYANGVQRSLVEVTIFQ
jgi:hypothetical protein